ncbi:MAG TPA: hypothetical protein VLY04_10455 [Bryobacteraceae bacterium]|nr:hypothetical protein [Bryobacteraceae bacterium]
MRPITLLATILAALAGAGFAQIPAARDTLVDPAIFGGLQWRGIGPAATGGRIADFAIAKVPGEPATIYVATTTGGVFKSANEGVSWTPVFDHAGGMMSIGAVAVAPSNPSVVWVGTGEADNRQSSSWGDGVYKSTDGGFTWEKMGLEETRHIGKIIVHPTDPNTVWIAAVGHLWGSNAERGVYKTTNGGKSWKKVLYKDDNTGAIDLAMDPKDPEVVFAALYQRQRKGWGFNGGGPGGGIYRTTDGGVTWTQLRNGLPSGDKGRIGLCIFPGDNRVVYAIVEADGSGGNVPSEAAAAGGRGGRGGAAPPAPSVASPNGVYRSLDQGETWEHMSGLNPRPMYYSRIYVDPKEANRVYIMGSNRGFYVSDDAGRSFHDVFSNVHGEDHALWIDPDNTNHLVIGGDGGVSISYDRGRTWLFRLNLPIGQFYNIAVNNRDPYLVCGGLQDNGNWCTPSATNINYGVSFKEAFNIGGGDGMQTVFEGDDHTILVSLQNGSTARLDLDSMERQTIGPVQPNERPQPGRPAYRWYWTTPLIVSSFDPNTIYTGANILFRSNDRGVSWKAISPDLTAGIDREKLQMMGAPIPARALSRNDGQSNFSALTVIAESPLDRNVLYTGADDGSIHVTRDGGEHWSNLTDNIRGLPPMLSISGIVASKHAPGRAYLSVDGHFNDDYRPYIFVSEDYGKTWRSMVNGLPQTSVHRVREHPTNPNLLVAGLEMGVYASFDRGAHWTTLNANMPPVPVYDLVYQERDNALVLGTHGRGIWILDHAGPLAEITPELLSGDEFLFSIPPAHHQVIYQGQFWFGAGEFFAPNPPNGAVLTYYLSKSASAVQISIADSTGKTIRTLRGPSQYGINRACWDLHQSPAIEVGPVPLANCSLSAGTPAPGLGGGGRGSGGPRVLPGRYTVTVTPAGLQPMKSEVAVLPDPRFTISDADRAARHTAVMSAYSLQQQLVPARDAAQTLVGQISAMREYLIAAGAGGRTALESVEKVSAQVTQIQGQITRALTSANGAQTAMDGYAGLPTASQVQQLDWAWEDAIAAATALNNLIQQSLPPVYAALGPSVKWPEIQPAPVPARPF